MKSIIGGLNTQDFIRVRIGVGKKPKSYDLADYVLGHFTQEEREVMDVAIIRAVSAIQTIVTENADKAMNLYNHKADEEEAEETEE